MILTNITEDAYIIEQLKRFKLVDMREKYSEIIEDAIREKYGYKEFLIKLLQSEEDGKNQRLTRKTHTESQLRFHKNSR